MISTLGPDFLCIGMQKAGTGWLYDQLQFHPDFWMPPVKEFHYFDRAFPDTKLAALIPEARISPDRVARKRERKQMRALDERDFAFFADSEACCGREHDLTRYAGLFRHKGSLISGDVTPAYSTLAAEVVKRIATFFPSMKVILLLRDPVARAWSQISMTWRRGKFPDEIMRDPARFRDYLHQKSVLERSFATEVFKRWSPQVGEQRMRFFFLDHVESEPESVRAEILSFLGADPGKSSSLVASFNRKSTHEKLELTDMHRRVLVEHLAGELEAGASLFGGPAIVWKSRYGV